MAERPNVLITQQEESPISTPSPTVLQPVVLGDLRQAVQKADSGSTYDGSTGTSVSYPLLETLAVPLVRRVDDRVLGGHEEERVYSEWDLLDESQDLVDALLAVSNPYTALERTETTLGSGSFPLTTESYPLLRDTVTVQDTVPTTFFAEGDDFTVNYDTGTISVVASSALDTLLGGAGTVTVTYSVRPTSSVVAWLQFVDTFSTVPNPTLTFQIDPKDLLITATSVTALPGIAFPSGSDITIASEPQPFDASAGGIETADEDVTVAHTDLIAGTITVAGPDGKVYTETSDYTVVLATGVFTLLKDGQIDLDDISVVFITYNAEFPTNPKILISYLASRVSEDGTLLELSTRDDLEAIAGATSGWTTTIGPYNPLLFGMAVAQNSAGGNIVGGIAQRSDNVTEVLELLEKNDIYTIALMSPDVGLASQVKAHVLSQSLPAIGQERVVTYGPETRLERSVYPFDELFDAISVANLDSANEILWDGNYNPTLTDSSLGPPKAGDQVEILGKTMRVTGVTIGTSPDTAAYYLEDAAIEFPGSEPAGSLPTVPGTPPVIFTQTHAVAYRVIRPLQRTEIIDLAEADRLALDDRRAWMMIPDIVKYDFEGNVTVAGSNLQTYDLPGFIRGAHVAGLRTIVLANQSLTNFVLTNFTGARHTNDLFTRAEIDDLIKNGIDLAVIEGSSLRSLRALTTDASTLGNAEQSIVSTVDFGVKKLRRVLRQFIGVYNVTDNTLQQLRLAVQGVEADLRSSRSDRTGPVVQRIDIVSLERHETFKDRVVGTFRFVIAAPLNVIEVTVLF
jgi:hypothetical protein